MRKPDCHPDRPYQAKGMCSSCYMKDYDQKRGNGRRRKDPSEYSADFRKPPSKPRRNADCHPDRPHVALGMCRTCYQKDRPDRPRAVCHPERPLVANGLCGSCNMRTIYWGDPEKHRAASREASAKTRQRVRDQMIEAYGSKCACVNCPETDTAFLTLDHINGDGKQHRAKVGSHTYTDLRRQGWPQDGYRLLCWNCNGMTRGGRTCPHETQ